LYSTYYLVRVVGRLLEDGGAGLAGLGDARVDVGNHQGDVDESGSILF